MAKTKNNALEVASEYIKKLREAGIRVNKAYLYGSYARETAKKDSDIDVAIISSDFTGDRFNDTLFLKKFRMNLDLRIEPLPMKPEDFIEENPIVSEILRYGIPLNETMKEYLGGKILKTLSNIFNGELLSVIIYGSYAEGRETPYSDIDILIILDKKFSNWRERRRIDVLLRRETSSIYQISPKVISERELTSSLENYNPLILNILLSGKPIYDTGIFAKAKKQFESMYGKKIVKNAENYWEIAL